MAEPITNVLGIVSIRMRGEYSNDIPYEKLNAVRYQGQTYLAKIDTLGNLPTNTTYWDLMVEKGEKGDKPVKGVDYYTQTDKAEIEADLSADVTSEVSSQLSDLSSATPIAVSSASGMTDTSRIYVNTTDGHWYWYNGTAWTDGGTYQATEIADGSIKYTMFSDEVKDNLQAVIKDEKVDLISTVNFERGSVSAGAKISSTTKIISDYIDVSKITEITVDPGTTYKYLVCFYTAKDESTFIGSAYGGFFSRFSGAYQSTKQNIHVLPPFKYARIVIGNAANDSTVVDLDEATNVKAMANYQLYNDKQDYDLEHQPFFEWINDRNYVLNYDSWNMGIPRAGSADSNLYIDNSLNRICTGLINVSKINGSLELQTSEGYQSSYYFANSELKLVTSFYWDSFYSVAIPNNAKYLIVGLSKTNGDALTPEDYNNIEISFEKNFPLEKKENVIKNTHIDLGWELGTLNPGTGTEGPSSSRIRSRYVYVGKGSSLSLNDTTYDHLIYTYDDDKVYESDLSWTNKEITINKDCYIRILLRKHNNATITEEEIPLIVNQESFNRGIPNSIIEEVYNPETQEEKIPNYYQTNISEAIEAVKNNSFDAGIDGDNFIFVTDVHWQGNAKWSPLLMKKIVDNTNINKIMCGGDLIGGGEKTAMINLMNDCIKEFKRVSNFYVVLGNHDTNQIGAPTANDYFTKSNAYTLMQKQTDFVMKYGNPCYFYFDNPTTKTRYICLDTGLEGSTLDNTQSEWISSTLNSMPDGYHALVFAHIIYQPTVSWHVGLSPEELHRTSFMNSVCTILDTFNTNNQNKKVEAIFGGHVHISCEFSSEGGIPIILTDCDTRQTFTETSPGSGERNQALKTINEQCFDIVTIDYTNRTIKCTRVGRGSNRTINY